MNLQTKEYQHYHKKYIATYLYIWGDLSKCITCHSDLSMIHQIIDET